tara:strand:+ start:16278 stop:16772 length:495 start_codon:yes stop_codon:yes gene_type:complete
MKIATFVAALAILLPASISWAQETDPASEIADQWSADQALRELRQARLDELMSTIAEEMQAIRSSENPRERETLMATHRESMREAMGLMRDMGGAHMREVMAEHMGPGPAPVDDSGRALHQHKRMSHAQRRSHMSDARRLADLENRVDMMQVMLESMMGDHQEN